MNTRTGNALTTLVVGALLLFIKKSSIKLYFVTTFLKYSKVENIGRYYNKCFLNCVFLSCIIKIHNILSGGIMIMKKRIMALILAGVMMFALCACTGGESGGAATMDPLTKDDVIDITITSHPSWPYLEDWKVWEYIEEGTGVTLNVTCIPGADASTKYPLMFAARDTLSDVVSFTYKPDTEKYVSQGALVALDDMEQYMPNYKAWVESLTEEEYDNVVKTRKSADGKIYYAPVSGRERSQNVRAWLYRKDIFEKHNLKVPTTFDELYEVCKELKALYPDSYPYCLRQSFTNLDVSGASWKPYWCTGLYFDYNADKWCYGATEETMRDVLEFYIKMVEEKLMPSDFMTINNTTWQELITTNRGFILPEYQTRIDFFNSLARPINPDFDLHAMVPPVADPENGVAMVNRYNVDPTGLTITNTGDEKSMANAAKFVDWFYSDEGSLRTSWGKEGETYEVVDGKKQYITDEAGTQANTLYGLGTYGSFLRMDPEAVLAFESEDLAETRDMVLEHTMPYANPTITLAFNAEEQKVVDEYQTAITNYAQEMITKFILKQEPLSKYDEFVENLYDMELEKLLAAYESAFARVK